MSSWAAVDATIDEAVATGVFPGGVLLVGDAGREVRRRAYGRLATHPTAGAEVTADTIYDTASLTKAIVTTSLVMRLVEAGVLDLSTQARIYVPELARTNGTDRIRVRDLLSHSAGFPAWAPFYERAPHGPREAILQLAAATPLEAAPGERSLYSDLGFIVLGFLIERAAGERLDALAARALFAPLGMRTAGFVDLLADPRPALPGLVAPTEIDPRRGLVHGEVHDENCWAAGGILGHAGLFAAADDVGRVAAALCAAWNGERIPGGFPPELAREFLAPCGVPGSTWRLGWDGPAAAGTQAGDLWPKSGSGHLGFTGCSVWLDPPAGRWVVLLTNRVHPSREDQRIKQARARIQDAVVRALQALG
jgi:CubicO group peptidase (beta-lactamase class C family)